MTEDQNTSVCEEDVFQSIYEEQIAPVRNFLYYKCGDLDRAEDMAQDSFIKMWENCAKVIFGKAKSYVFTIANRLFLNEVRDEKVKLKFETSTGSRVETEDPEYLAIHAEFKQSLESAISNLPEKQREVFLMNRIDNMKYSEIAATLNISVKAVEKRMHQCLKTLKNEVKELRTRKI